MRSIAFAGIFWAVFSANSAAAAPVRWEVVANKTPNMCTATAPSGKGLVLGISAEGPDFVLKVWATDFPKVTKSYQATLLFKGGDGGPVAAVGNDGMMAISLGRGELAAGTVKATEATLTVENVSHTLSLLGAAAAMDAVARCAKQPTLAEAPEKPPLPIPDAGDWTLYETTPYQTGKVCMAHLNDPEVDTMLEYDAKDTLVLTGGNAIWAFPSQDIPMHISIDGGPDLPIPARLEGHIFSMKIEDQQMIEQLRHAQIIDWVFPNGSLRSAVTGLGTALDAVQKCRTVAHS